MADVLITFIDLVNEFGNIDIVRVGIPQTVIETSLQGGSTLSCLCQLILQTFNPCIVGGYCFFRTLVVCRQLVVLRAAILQIFLAGTTTENKCTHSQGYNKKTLFHNHILFWVIILSQKTMQTGQMKNLNLIFPNAV